MSQSFDDKIKSRLEGYESRPPEWLKGEILDKPSRKPRVAWIALPVAGLIGLAMLFFIRREDSDHSAGELVQSVQEVPAQDRKQGHEKDETPLLVDTLVAERTGSAKDVHKAPHIMRKGESVALARTEERNVSSEPYEVEKKVISWKGPEVSFPDDLLARQEDPENQDRWLRPYGELGFLFLYNRIAPNPNDEVFVQDFKSSGGVSPDRLGLSAEVGLQGRLSEKMNLKLGISFMTFRQHYYFDVRNFRPDTVVATGTNLVEPTFNSRTIEVDTRLYLMGFNGTVEWKILPSRHDVLLAGISYQQQFGQVYEITYEEETYPVFRRSHLFVNMGLRKTIYETRNGSFFLIPNIRYSVINRSPDDKLFSFKPFSVGVTVSYGIR